jgi:cytochrome c peroxidase
MSGRYAVTVLAAAVCFAQPNPPPGSLKSVPIPRAQGLDDFVRDRHALQVLGKALFWDMQAGSDGRTACATCHFHAGADHRRQNQISDPNNPFPANHMLEAGDFPFRRFFDAIRPGDPAEAGQELFDLPGFLVGGLQVRSVTARNSPSVINAVFNVSNFWDGRASRFFNGFDPSGAATPGVLVFRVTTAASRRSNR